jgi:hypothetical protein
MQLASITIMAFSASPKRFRLQIVADGRNIGGILMNWARRTDLSSRIVRSLPSVGEPSLTIAGLAIGDEIFLGGGERGC